MRRLILAALVICTTCTNWAQTLVTVTDTVTYPGPPNPNGTITLSWNNFLNASHQPVAQGRTVVQVVNGFFTVNLLPTDSAIPVGTCYVAQWNLNNQNFTRTWNVPTSGSPINLNTVQSTTRCSPQTAAAIAVAQLTNSGATTGQCIAWNGMFWSPGACGGGGGGMPGGTNGQLQFNSLGAFGGFTPGGDCVLTRPNFICTKTNGVSFAASATVDTTNAANITVGVLPVAHGGTGTGTQFNPGSIVFAGAGGVYQQDNAKLFWNDATDQFTVTGATQDQFRIIGSGAGASMTVTASTGNNAANINVTSGGGGGSGDHAYFAFNSPGGTQWNLTGIWNGIPNFVLRDPAIGLAARFVVAKSTGDVILNTNETDSGYKLDIGYSGVTGTLRVYDQTPSTGVTNVDIREGAGQSASAPVRVFSSSGGLEAQIAAGGFFNTWGGALSKISIGSNQDLMSSDTCLSWNSATGLGTGSIDTTLCRNAAGILQVTNDFITRNITINGTCTGTGCGATTAAQVVSLFTGGCSGVMYLGADGACHAPGGGGSSIFTSYQFGSTTAITGTANYVQTTYPAIFSLAQTGSGSMGSPFIDAITLANENAGTVWGNPTGSAAAPTFTRTPVLGVNGSVAGTLGFASAGGTATTTVQAGTVTGAWTLTLPTGTGISGQVLSTNGAGVTSWINAAGGGTVSSCATSGAVTYYASTGTTVTCLASVIESAGQISLGASGTQGQLAINGTTSGTVNVTTAAVAGSWTMALPTSAGSPGQALITDGTGVTSWSGTSGGFLVSATSSTLTVLSAGVIQCPAANYVISGTSTTAVRLAGSASETLWVGFSCTDQHLKLIAPTDTFTCTVSGFAACDTVTGSAFTSDIVRLASVALRSGGGVWTFGAVTDLRATLGQFFCLAGTGISVSGVCGLSVDTTAVPLLSTVNSFSNQTTPAAPSAGFTKVYPKSGSGLCALDSSSVESCTGGGAGAGALRYVSVPISSTQIKNLVGTPITLVPAPGTNFYIEVVSVSLVYQFGTMAYTGGATTFIAYGNGQQTLGNFGAGFANTVLQSGSSQVSFSSADVAITQATTNIANQPLVTSNSGSNFAAGDGTAFFHVVYRIVPTNG